MTRSTPGRLLGPLWAWTIITGVFAWLPLVRILGRPEGYTWGVLGLSGAGADGPYWIFLAATAWVLAALFTVKRGPRRLSWLLLPTWHLALAAVVVAAVVLGGREALWQGQGLRFAIPMWILVVPFVVGAGLAVAWAVLDYRAGDADTAVARRGKGGRNLRLVLSGVLLAVALALFRAGDNYNWITATAIIATVLHWILLAESFEPRGITETTAR